MTIAVVGLNYRTAPVEMREKLTLSGCTLPLALDDLRQLTTSGLVDEAVILSTCNRLEIYISAQSEGGALVEQFIANLQNIPGAELKPHLYHFTGDTAIQHLMRVACGLDSMILGETQILGQVTQAFEEAHRAGLTGSVLSHLFAQAIHTGKRAHTETTISRSTTSVSHAAARLLVEKVARQQTARVLIIGAGEMAKLAAQALNRLGITDTAYINRTYSRAEALANEIGGKALTWYQLEEALVWADAVICATGAPHTVIFRSYIESILNQRQGRPLVLIDIAVPRDVEEGVRTLPGIQYYDIDDLQSVVDANLEQRKASIPQVEQIIEREMARFAEWYRGRQVTPVIKDLREWAQGIAEDELTHTLNRLSDADDHTREIVSRMAHRLVNRLLHEPTTRLRLQAVEGKGVGYVHAVRELFALESLEALDCLCEGQQNRACNLQCIVGTQE